MFNVIKRLSMVVVVIGILTGAITAAGAPVQAQQNSSDWIPASAGTTEGVQIPDGNGATDGVQIPASAGTTGGEVPASAGTTGEETAPDATLIAQATDIDQTDPDATPADPAAATTPEDGAAADDYGPTCEGSVGTMGWVICPFIRITYEGFNFLVENVLEDGLLRINILDDGEQELRLAWAGFRTLANLIFAIAFFVIIYAEATGRVGILETYSATRMLPKIALSVMGIQLSYFISAYLIGFFNDMGEGVTALVLAPVQGFDTFELTFTDFGDGNFFGLDAELGEGFVDSFIGIAVIAAVGWIAYVVLETVLILSVFGLALMFFTLILRKILIVALVVVSPIAFAAWVLPGTDRVFKLWWDSFIKALAMYPLIMLLIASGQLVGRLAVVGDATFVDSMVSMIATFGPLFLIPATFKFAGSAVASVGGLLTNVSEKGKGDLRDPNSTRSRLRQRRGQRYGRMMNGQARTPSRIGGKKYGVPLGPLGRRSIMPSSIARAYNRLPNTDTTASLIADIQSGREAVDIVARTMGDTVVKAAAVTGGGQNKGMKVRTTSGFEWAGYKKLGKHYAVDPVTGRIATHNGRSDGIAMMRGANGEMVQATKDDFYDRDTMSQARKYSSNLGFVAAAAEHTMSKTDNNNYLDQQQLWDGLNSTKWTKDEKIRLSQGVWNKVKDQGIHHKFSDWQGFFDEGSTPIVDSKTGIHSTKKMDVKFADMVNFVDAEMQNYPIMNQKAPSWNALNQGMIEYATKTDGSGVTAKMRDVANPNTDQQTRVKLHSLAYKAMGLVNSNRASGQQMGAQQVVPEGDDGDPIAGSSFASGSGATGSAAREAERFLKLYKEHIGDLPSGSERGMFEPPVFR